MDIVQASCVDDIRQINKLMYDSYLRLGYIHKQQNETLPYDSAFSSADRTTVFAVRVEDELVGSISLSLCDNHLPRNDFQQEIKNLVKRHKRLVCGWRLVVREDYANRFVPRMLARTLVNEAFERYGEDVVGVVEFEAELEAVYRRIFRCPVVAWQEFADDGVQKDRRQGLIVIDNYNMRRLREQLCPSLRTGA